MCLCCTRLPQPSLCAWELPAVELCWHPGCQARPPASTHLLRVVLSWERRVVALLYLLAEGEEVHFISIEGAL